MLNPTDPCHYRNSITEAIYRSASTWGDTFKHGYAKTLDAVGGLSSCMIGTQELRAKDNDTEMRGRRTANITAALSATKSNNTAQSALPRLAENLLGKAPSQAQTTKIQESIPTKALKDYTDEQRKNMRANRFASTKPGDNSGTTTASLKGSDHPGPESAAKTMQQQLLETEQEALYSANVLSLSVGPMAIMQREIHSKYMDVEFNDEVSSVVKDRLKRDYYNAFDQEKEVVNSEREMSKMHREIKRARMRGPKYHGEREFDNVVTDLISRLDKLTQTSRLEDTISGNPRAPTEAGH
jgi:hypothetical protein